MWNSFDKEDKISQKCITTNYRILMKKFSVNLKLRALLREL